MNDSGKNVTTGSVAVLGAGGTMGKGIARDVAAAELR
jgi:predicted amino acid dehydrogenase